MQEATAALDERYAVRPVMKALQVLKLICEARRPVPLSAIVLDTGLPKTTVFRYLYSLGAMGLVELDAATDGYRAGLGAWWLAQAANPYESLRTVALPEMRRLQQEFNETVNLGILAGGEVVYLEIVESERSLRTQAKAGARDTIHSTALGKALLAHRAPAEWEDVLAGPLEPRTTRTVIDRTALRRQLQAVRSTGLAFDEGENEEGSYCVAAPVLGRTGAPAAALSISAPAARITPNILARIRLQLPKACEAIAAKLTAF